MHYSNYHLELSFDQATGQLTISFDSEAANFVNTILNPEYLVNCPFSSSHITAISYKINDPGSSPIDYFDHYTEIDEQPPLQIKDETVQAESLCTIDPCVAGPNYSRTHSRTSTTSFACTESATPDTLCSSSPTPSEALTEKYSAICNVLEQLQQLPCKVLVKSLIRKAIKCKKTKYPYKDGENAKPHCWPSDIPHIQPDHMSKNDRIGLMYHFLMLMPLCDIFEICRSFKLTLPQHKQVMVDRLLYILEN